MPAPWLGILLVLVLLGGFMSLVSWGSARFQLHPELSRKLVHIVMGVVTLSFPWLFSASWPVLLLAVLAVAALAGTRLLAPLRNRFGGVLHGVKRHSLGEIYFPLAVAALFMLSSTNRLLYLIPLLTLTLADAVAALVGTRYGTLRYATSEGSKSAEGSVAFFTVAFLSAHVPLLLMSQTGRAESLLIALVLGVLVMLFEAISVGGLDNLFIPLGSYLLLKRYLNLESEALLFRLAAITLLALLVFFWRRRTTLKESALLAAALVGYMNWALGGWPWLAVSLILFFTYTRLWPRSKENSSPVHTVRAVVTVSVPGMVWLLAALETGQRGYFFPFLLSYAAHLMIIGLVQLGHARKELPFWQRVLWAVSLSWLVFLPFFFLALPELLSLAFMDKLQMAGGALLLLLATGWGYLLTTRLFAVDNGGTRRWIGQGLFAFAASLVGWLLLPMVGG
jgi:phytol kinase